MLKGSKMRFIVRISGCCGLWSLAFSELLQLFKLPSRDDSWYVSWLGVWSQQVVRAQAGEGLGKPGCSRLMVSWSSDCRSPYHSQSFGSVTPGVAVAA